MARRGGLGVPGQGGIQAEPDGVSVMDPAEHAQGVAHGMGDGGPRGVEGDARQGRRDHQLAAGVEIAGLGQGAGQGACGAAGVTRHQADGVQPIGVGHRVAAPHRAGLDGVDHGVDPGGGGERLGPGDRQGRVEDRQIGPQGVAPGP